MLKYGLKFGVKQRGKNDCAVASLATIIKFFGGKVSFEKLKRLIKLDKQGGTAYGILKASQSVGLNSEVLTGEFHDLLSAYQSQDFKLPCIAHTRLENGMQHFVVLLDIQKKYVAFFDPASGKKRISAEYFKKIWTNNIIVFSKISGRKVERESFLKVVLDYSSFLKGKHHLLFIAIILSMLLSLSNIAIAFIYGEILEHVATDAIPHTLVHNNFSSLETIFLSQNFVRILLIVAVFFGIQFIFLMTRTLIVSTFSQRINNNLSSTFISKIVRTDYDYFMQTENSELLAKFQAISEIQYGIGNVLLIIILESFSLIVGSFLLFHLNSSLSLITYLMGIILVLLSAPFFQPLKKLKESRIYQNGQNLQILSEISQGIKTIKHHAKEPYFENKFLQSVKEFTSINKREMNVGGILSNVVFVTEGFFMICILLQGAFYITRGSLSIGSLITFETIVPFFIFPIKNIMSMQPEITKLTVAIHQFNEISGLSMEKDVVQTLEISKGEEKVASLKNISFSYNFDKEILNLVSFDILRGKKIGIIGINGSGKSTLLKICAALLESDSGLYELSLQDSEGSKSVFRKNSEYISQESEFFTGTIFENLLVDSTEKLLQYEKDLKEIGFIDLIKEFPLGLETVITEQATNLSGGQRQLIALARGILSDSKIFFIDEGSSNLDGLKEKKMFAYLFDKRKKITVVSIFHDLRLAENFDEILVLHDGKIIEKGSYSKLAEDENSYLSQLYKL